MNTFGKGYPKSVPNASRTWMMLWALTWVSMSNYLLGDLDYGYVGTQLLAYTDILVPSGIVFYVYGLGRNSKIVSVRFIFWCLAIFLYGSAVGLLNNGLTTYWRYDATVFVAFFAGIALAEVLPKILPIITKTIVVCLWVCMIVTIVALSYAENIELLEEGARITSYQSFVASYGVICLAAPAWILIRITGGKVLRALVQISIIGMTGLATFVLQTRSLLISMIIAILLALMGTHCIVRTERIKNKATIYTWSILAMAIIISTIAISLLMPLIKLQWQSLFDRSQDLRNSYTMTLRFEESRGAIGAMSHFEHITGKGFGGIVAYTNEEGTRNLHLAIFNIWTRFGVVVFILVILYLLKTTWDYCCLCLIKPNGKLVSHQSADIGTLVCTSGLLSLATIATMSGGWSPIAGLCLGILFGLRGSIANGLIRSSAILGRR